MPGNVMVKGVIMQFDDLGKLFQGNFGNLIQQAQEAQKKMQNMQNELKDKYVEGSAGGGMVKATVNGQQQIIKIDINPEVINSDPEEKEFLEEMIVAAINQGIEKSKKLFPDNLKQMTGGLDMSQLGNLFK